MARWPWALPLVICLACSGASPKNGAGGSFAGGTGAGGASAGDQPGGAGGPSGTGVAGSGGTTAAGGTSGAGGASCSFDIQGAPSTAIPTVGVVQWSTTLAGLTDARVEFTLNDPTAAEVNRGGGGAIDVAGQTHRALLLGLKPQRSYTFRIVARAGATVCTSPDRSLTTGALADADATVRLTVTRAAQGTAPPGFIVTSDFNKPAAYIIDADGEIVWWAGAPLACSRARIDWEGRNMWTISVNGNQGGMGEVRRISMDGTDVTSHVTGLDNAHHDLTVLPGGIVATFVWSGETTSASDLVERAPDGTLKTVVRLDSSVLPQNGSYHDNSIAYHATSNTYTVGDLDLAGFAKLARDGKLIWLIRVNDFFGNHGHHLLDDSHLFVFKARMTPSPVVEYLVTEDAATVMASKLWSYTPANELGSIILGDVQRLSNGNLLIDYSEGGEIRELTPASEIVQTIQTFSSAGSGLKRRFGYADFRESLYDPPPR